MGNSRARAVYEANLPDGFRRPQTDSYAIETCSWSIIGDFSPFSALESFIRAKYEQRKWIAKEWIPPEITVPIDVSVVLCHDLIKSFNFIIQHDLFSSF